MLNSHDPVSISFWTKEGKIVSVDRAVSLSYDTATGTRNIKSLTSGEIRRVRDVCIFEINSLEVFA